MPSTPERFVHCFHPDNKIPIVKDPIAVFANHNVPSTDVAVENLAVFHGTLVGCKLVQQQNEKERQKKNTHT